VSAALPQRLDRRAVVVEQAPAPPREVVIAAGPTWQAFQLLHWAFVVIPLTAGADKFFGVLAPWRDYLSPTIPDLLGLGTQRILHGIGIMEILAGLIVAFAPRVGGWLLAGWLWAIVINLLSMPGYADIALRDAGLSLAALALARLAVQYQDAVEPPRVRG
jgi:hypothetical protein